MKANFHKFLHQMRFKLLKLIAPANYTLPPALPNSEKLSKISLLKKIFQSIYKSVSKSVKFSAFKHFFFAQDAGGITQGYLSISGSNTGILGGHITESVTALQQMQDIGNGNSRAFDAGLAKPDSLFDDNTRGRGNFDNLVHSNDYNTNYGI